MADYLHFAINTSYIQQGRIAYVNEDKTSELVHQFEILVPTSLFVPTRLPIVQLNVDLITFNGSKPLADKALSVHIDFVDSLQQLHTTLLYNSLTPYIASGTSLNWSDTLSLNGIQTVGLDVIPLKVNVYLAASEALEADYKLKLSLTRINIL